MVGWIPNKKSIWVLGGAAIVLVGTVFVVKNDVFGSSNDTQNSEKISVIDNGLEKVFGFFKPDVSKKDSDDDGLMDWEEELWKTDKNNPDTDGDSSLDGDEIKQSRDPLVAGPNDSLADKEKTAIDTTVNETEMITGELLLGYLGLKQDGQFSNIDKETLINSVIENNSLSSDIRETRYSIDDIIISDDYSSEALKSYYNSYMAILGQGKGLENDLSLFQEMVKNKDTKKMQELKSNNEVYSKMLNNLVVLSVPRPLADIHLGLVNAIANLVIDIKKMAEFFNDPIMGVVGFRDYVADTEEIYTLSEQIGEYLKNNNIDTNVSSY